MLELSDVSVKVGQRTILENISFMVEPRQVLGIIGPNGAGKTTLLRVLTGELTPLIGRVRLGAHELSHEPIGKLAQKRAYLAQHPTLAFGFSVLEVVLLGRTPHRTRETKQNALDIAERAMALADVSEFAERDYIELSGGEQQRVQLARVLAQIWTPVEQQSRLLLLDEPTASLDLRYQHTMLSTIRHFAESGVAVVIVLHDLALAAQYTDRLLLLEAGRALALGKTRDVLILENVRQAFGVKSHAVTVPEAGLSLIVASGPDATRVGEGTPSC